MKGDVRFYRDRGVEEMANVQVLASAGLDYAARAANPGFALLPRLLWNPDESVPRFIAEFCQRYYRSTEATEAFRLIERADRAAPMYADEAPRDGGQRKHAARLLKRALAGLDRLPSDRAGRRRARTVCSDLRSDLERLRTGDAMGTPEWASHADIGVRMAFIKSFGLDIPVRSRKHLWWPHHTGKPARIPTALVLRHEGAVVSLVGVYPFQVTTPCGQIKVAGIGGVGTDPRWRSRGLMSHLLRVANQEMRRQGYVLSILWGARRRYNRYGWETGGVRHRFQITAADAARIPHDPNVGVQRVRRLTPGQFRAIARIYRRRALRVVRTDDHMRWALSRDALWAASAQGRSAYLTLCQHHHYPEHQVFEFGGDRGCLLQIVRKLLQGTRRESISVLAPDDPSGMLDTWRALGEKVPDVQGMIQIVSLAALIGHYRPYLRDRARAARISGRLSFSIPARHETVSVALGGATRSQSDADIALTELEMVRLLFGPRDKELIHSLSATGRAVAKAVLPLPFHFCPLDCV